MQKTEHDEREEHSSPDAEEEEGYAAFPGGIPKRWLNPAVYLFLIILGAYALWVGSGEILDGRQAGIHLRKTMGVIWSHLSDFAFNLTIAMIGGSKILERIMYYLQAKKLAKQHEQRADAAEQLAAEYKQQLEQERLRADAAKQLADEERLRADATKKLVDEERSRAEAAKKLADAAKQLADEERLRADAAKQLVDEERLRADAAEKRAEAAEAKNGGDSR